MTTSRPPAADGAGHGSPAAGEELLRVRDVDVRFGGLTALTGVGFEVAAGQVLGLIGPNGAGKTTLFNVVCGYVRPAAGEVLWRGRPLRRIRPHALAGLGIARTQQGLGLFEHLTVMENVMVGADRHARSGLVADLLGLPGARRDALDLRTRALAALHRVGVADSAGRRPGSLPYGLRKRVGLARALVAEPRLLLLDEPAAGLSDRELAELGELIGTLRGEMAVVLVEHHMDLVMAVCDRIVVLDFGRVIAVGTPQQVRTDTAVLDAYLGPDVREAG